MISLILILLIYLGGINCIIDSTAEDEICNLKDDLLVIGADVTHPCKNDNFNYSISSVVASIDSSFTKYACQVKIQPKSNEEIIKDMKDIILKLIDLFIIYKYKIIRKSISNDQDNNDDDDDTDNEKINLELTNLDSRFIYNLLPKHILYYRDGISENQYEQFKNIEIQSIRDAFFELSIKKNFTNIFKPNLNSVIVLKRHPTKFIRIKNDEQQQFKPTTFDNLFEAKNSDQTNLDDLNILPGTVIKNRMIVKTDHEFYLNSHKTDKGTIRCTHYDLILNESNFQLNQIEIFTYQLCYLYGKSMKSTSVPIPIKYSHLACYRARSHLSSYLDDDKNDYKKSEIDNLTTVESTETDLLDQTTSSFTKSTNLFDQSSPFNLQTSFFGQSNSSLDQQPTTSFYFQQQPSLSSYYQQQPNTSFYYQQQQPSTSSFYQQPLDTFSNQPTLFGLPYPNRPPPPLNQPPIFSLSNPLLFSSIDPKSSPLNQSNLQKKSETIKSKRKNRGRNKNKDGNKKDVNKEITKNIDENLQEKVQVKENLRMTFYFL